MLMLFGGGGQGALAAAFCAVHELSHLFVMALCGVAVHSVTLSGAGIGIKALSLETQPTWVQAAVLFAGSASNVVLAGALYLLKCPAESLLCLLTGVINLLPVGALDGARLLKIAVVRFAAPQRVDRICKNAELFVVAVGAALLVVFFRELGFAVTAAAAYFLLMNALNAY